MDALPCQLCWFARELNSAGYILVWCDKYQDIVCDKQWIDPEKCWKHCICAKCPWRTLEENNPWGE